MEGISIEKGREIKSGDTYEEGGEDDKGSHNADILRFRRLAESRSSPISCC
jgi:hypothetical protein